MENEKIPMHNYFSKLESKEHVVKEAFQEIPSKSIQLEVAIEEKERVDEINKEEPSLDIQDKPKELVGNESKKEDLIISQTLEMSLNGFP